MARQSFTPTDELRSKVKKWAALGATHDDIANAIGCTAKTLRRHFRRELDTGVAEANAALSGYLFNAAKAGKVKAQIFWLKTKAGWREAEEPSGHRPQRDQSDGTEAEMHAGSEAGISPQRPRYTVWLPHNNRDPYPDPELEQKIIKVVEQHRAAKREREQARPEAA